MTKTESYDLQGGGENSNSGKGERGEWGNQIEFLLACVGYAVGLGNVWRFPYLAYTNGGGVFLIPYVISLLIAGLPIFYLELCIGQFSSLGANRIYRNLVPIFQGLGWAMVLVSFVVSIYYNIIMAWILFYFIASFRKELAWEYCTNSWNTILCHSNLEEARCTDKLGAQKDSDVFFFNKTCYWMNNTAMMATRNNTFTNGTHRLSPAEEYFNNYMYGLNEGEGFGNMGGLQWKLCLCLLGAWLVVFFCLIKGVQSTGKVVYFTATFPYVILVILLIRGVTLEGASEGIRFYITPQFDKLTDINIWRNAATQIFYSLGPAFGGLLTMASYNKFSNNCFRDAVIVAFTNCGTSIFAGFAIFSTLGFMAHELNKNVSDVVASGPSLAFIAYPEAIVRMPLSPLWSLLFFFMLFALGLDTQFAMVETVTTAFLDEFPILRRKKWAVVGSCSLVMYCLALPMCLRDGVYIFTIFDKYAGGYSLILIALLEFLCIMYIYGLSRMIKDIQLMLGAKTSAISKIIGPTGYYFRIVWLIVAPIYCTAILVFSFIYQTDTKYGDYGFPSGADLFGWGLGTIPVVAVPLFMVIRFAINRINGEPFMDLFRVTDDWCPAHIREKRKDQPFSVVLKQHTAQDLGVAYTNPGFIVKNGTIGFEKVVNK